MGRMLRRGVLVLLLVFLALGVGSAAGRSLVTTSVTVQVIGKGKVTSSPSGLKCGNDNKACILAFSSATITLTPSPADNWEFDEWDCMGTDEAIDGADCEITPSGVDSSHEVTAKFKKSSGASTSTLSVNAALDSADKGGNVDGGDIDCGSGLSGACSWTVLTGSTLTLRQTPDAGFVFSGWGGACSGTGQTCTVEMSGDSNVSASWSDAAGAPMLLTATVNGGGKVTGGGINCSGPATCTANQPLNSTVALTAEPDDGYVFTGWSGDCSGTSPTCTLTMSEARTVTATFSPTLSVTVNGNGGVTGGTGAINCGNGATICSAAFAQNATVTLTATAATGSTFLGWSGACGGTATSCTVLMSAARAVTANFSTGTAGTVALTVTVTGNGRVTGGGINCGLGSTACSANVTLNTNVTLTATPDTGATFTGWGGSCSGTTTCTVAMTSARSVTATFAGGTSTTQLTVTVTGNGTVTGGGIQCGGGSSTCSARPALNSSVTLTATPAAGASFTGWGGACSGTARTCTVVMNAVKTVSAAFTGAAGPGTLTLNVTGRGTVSSSAGRCIATGPKETCVQRFTAGRSVTLAAAAAAGAAFLRWSGACTGTRLTCTVRLNVARTVNATFSTPVAGRAVLTSLGAPVVKRSAKGYLVTLRFRTTRAGLARVRALRAGRVATSVSLRVAAGSATIGPFPVPKPGLYTFQVSLGGKTLGWRACLGRCGAAAPGPPFLLTRETPTVTRAGDVWSVTLHFRANAISAARVQASTSGRKLVDQRFLARAGRIVLGPFLLGPGNYTIRLTATDPYGRTRTLTWIVALAR